MEMVVKIDEKKWKTTVLQERTKSSELKSDSFDEN